MSPSASPHPASPPTTDAQPSRSSTDASTAPCTSPEHAWAEPADIAFGWFKTPADGLSPSEAVRRLSACGPNALRAVEPASIWTILVDQMRSLVVLLLVAAAVVSLLFGDVIEAGAIGIVLLLNTVIGFGMEWRAVRSMEALREFDRIDATVRRGGRVQSVAATEMVPGDVVLLNEGDVVSADLRLSEASRLRIDESALTGESVPVDKAETPVSPDAPLAERTCMAYKGTAVTSGSGEGVVTATGMHTELGEISELATTADHGRTPLEQRLADLAKSLVVIVLGLVAVISGLGVARGEDLVMMVEMGIALAVAAIPEGLPVVATIALARGLRRMARRNALVRRLSSVETLGSTTVICTDKTGTLTENRMTVERLVLPGRGPSTRPDEADMQIERLDTAPHTEAAPDGAVDAPSERSGEGNQPDALLELATWVSALCTTAQFDANDPDRVIGDPMEGALLQFAATLGTDPAVLGDRFPETGRVAFDRSTQMMASLHATDDATDGETLVLVKGTPEAVLEACVAEAVPGRDPRESLAAADSDAYGTDAYGSDGNGSRWHEAWLGENEAMASNGLRVLGLAAKLEPDADTDDAYTGLYFIGLIGLVDPPRSDVAASISACQRAGIEVVMVTGDQPATATYIARAVGILPANPSDGPDAPAIHGRDFANALDARTRQITAPVYARVTPKQKLQLIDFLQAKGHIVAMTGDGVNDAPALKRADIGVAMGQRGTQVVRESADVVLQDDAFATIAVAVEEGRTIFTNIRAFVRYLLSCNVGEIMVIGVAALAALPLPLLPLQILFLNLVTDVFPALALGMSESETDVMQDALRPPDEPILTAAHWWRIAEYGAVFTISVLGVLLAALHLLLLSSEQAVTASFLTLAFGQLAHVFNMRSPEASPIRNTVVQNPYVWGAIALCAVLLLLAVHLPVLANVLSITPLPLGGWLLVAGGSLVPLVIGQTRLALRAWRHR